ncbi:hypothetical protein QBC35DRAFT_544984 [Podospora australis]|uniref:Uncharacterized protein n=1 Tax=Podospora australis TaxID=1536484 RepID=A0AAN7AEM8_9PEZI|nr:hypothetical protein QBC35DRAFT_544984 [Podospora australis]
MMKKIQAALWTTATALAVSQRGPLPPRLPCSGESCYSVTSLEPHFFPDLQPERYKVRYGPFAVPSSFEDRDAEKSFYFRSAPPCIDCYVTNIQIDLESPNGTYANTPNGIFLSHLVMMNLEVDSVTCPLMAEPVFASGNERAEADLSLHGTYKAGYYLSHTTLLLFTSEFLNTTPFPSDAIIAIDYEFVPASLATDSGFKKVTPVWLDVAGLCSSEIFTAQVPASRTSPEFSLSMAPAWEADLSGDIISVTGHVNDGGENIEFSRNGTVVCDSRASYGDTSGDWGYAGYQKTTEHISSMSTCSFETGRIENGDLFSVTANYNLTKHRGLEDARGKLSPVRGVGLMYVIKDEQ